MENASKALLMTASILIGLIILSLGVYLANTFRSFSQEYNESIETQKMQQFNEQFTAIAGRNNVSIHEIVTLTNIAKEFNTTNGIESDNDQFIHIYIKIRNKIYDLADKSTYPTKYRENSDKFISDLLDGTYIYNEYGSEVEKEGQYQYDYINNEKVYYNCYSCDSNGYKVNYVTGRVESITFEFQKSVVGTV